MAGHGWKRLEMAGIVGNGWNGMAGNGWKWLKCLEVTGNIWKLLEWQEMAQHDWK